MRDQTIVYESDMREPYMGNTLPVKVVVHIENDKVKRVVLVNPEDIEYSMVEQRRFIMKQLPGDESG